MRHDLEVSKSIVINADPSKVWNALTNPEIIKEYLHGTETVTDWKIGSKIIFQGEYNGQKYRDHGVILKNILNNILSYSYWSIFLGIEDKKENYSTVTYTLTQKGGNQTELRWTQNGFLNEEAHKHSESGMDKFLGEIKAIIER